MVLIPDLASWLYFVLVAIFHEGRGHAMPVPPPVTLFCLAKRVYGFR